MKRVLAYLGSAVLLGGLALAVAECSGAQCGNGVKEGNEQCDNGAINGQPGNGCNAQCQLVSIPRASLQVFIYRLKDEAPGYDGADPTSLGIDHAHVVVAGPSAKDETWPANMNSNLWTNLTPGTYTSTVTLFDASGAALTNPVTSTMVDVAIGPNTPTLTINFHQSDFIKQDYTGTLYLDPNWGAMGGTCTGASPAVQMEGLTVTKLDGTPVSGMTVDGMSGATLHSLDGTLGACFSKNGNDLFEKVASMPWGHYKVTLVGKVAGGTIGYCTKVPDLFVGPGIMTPTYEIVVPAADADMGACP